MPTTLMCEPRLLQKDLHDRVYIVTGSNSGAGLATAKQRSDGCIPTTRAH